MVRDDEVEAAARVLCCGSRCNASGKTGDRCIATDAHVMDKAKRILLAASRVREGSGGEAELTAHIKATADKHIIRITENDAGILARAILHNSLARLSQSPSTGEGGGDRPFYATEAGGKRIDVAARAICQGRDDPACKETCVAVCNGTDDDLDNNGSFNAACSALLAIDRHDKKSPSTGDEMRRALEPFAEFADPSDRLPESFPITTGSAMGRRQLTMGDCYRARAALSPSKG